MLQALVLGNGESRKSLDIDHLSNHYTTFGCNAIVRDHVIDYLVCCDGRMALEANRITRHRVGIFIRQEYMTSFNRLDIYRPLPNLPYLGSLKQDQPKNWGSGPYALLLATEIGFPRVVLAGFDLHSKDGKINNIYKGTANYLSEDANAVDPAYWIYQIGKIFQLNPYVEFIILNEEGWSMPQEWHYDNVRFQNIHDFTVDKGN